MISPPKYLRPHDAAAFLRERYGFGAARSLAKLRVFGGGPAYRKAGRLVLYSEDDLIGWAESKIGTRRRSTSDKRSLADARLRKKSDGRRCSRSDGPQAGAALLNEAAKDGSFAETDARLRTSKAHRAS